jgi:hypothetical protein
MRWSSKGHLEDWGNLELPFLEKPISKTTISKHAAARLSLEGEQFAAT